MDGVREAWDGAAEDLAIAWADAGTQRRCGVALSVLIDGLVFVSLATRTAYARAQLSALDVLLCAAAVLGTVLFVWPHRRYQLADGTVLSVWTPGPVGRALFCYSNPLAVLVLLECAPRIAHSLVAHLALAAGITALASVLVALYERRAAQQCVLAAGSYAALEAFLAPRAFKPSADVATQT